MQLTGDSRSTLSRAELFLHLACEAPPDARVEFEAFLEAAIVFARAAVHRFQSRYQKHPDWKQWWRSLSTNPSVNFFRTERDWILKEAPPRIGQKIFAASISVSGAHSKAYEPQTAAEFYYFEDPGIPATVIVAKHLEALRNVLAQGERLLQ